jgi:hypothetical protein
LRRVLVRYKVKQDKAEENLRLVEAVYAELHEKKPAGLRYATLKADDGVTFFHLASIEADRGNPLGEIDAFKRFQDGIQERCYEPPAPTDLALVGAYGFFGD